MDKRRHGQTEVDIRSGRNRGSLGSVFSLSMTTTALRDALAIGYDRTAIVATIVLRRRGRDRLPCMNVRADSARRHSRFVGGGAGLLEDIGNERSGTGFGWSPVLKHPRFDASDDHS